MIEYKNKYGVVIATRWEEGGDFFYVVATFSVDLFIIHNFCNLKNMCSRHKYTQNIYIIYPWHQKHEKKIS